MLTKLYRRLTYWFRHCEVCGERGAFVSEDDSGRIAMCETHYIEAVRLHMRENLRRKGHDPSIVDRIFDAKG